MKKVQKEASPNAEEPTRPADRSRALDLKLRPGESADAGKARIALSPYVPNASTALDFTKGLFPDLPLNECISVLTLQAEAVHRGDLSGAESTLTAQATALDAIFNSLAKRAIHSEHMENLDRYLRLALKAQSQCRTTLETLASIKNPPTIFARQANIAHGPQQVNNGIPSRTGETEIEPNRLLEATDGERLDTGAASAAGRANQDLEAVGTVDGTEKRRRKG